MIPVDPYCGNTCRSFKFCRLIPWKRVQMMQIGGNDLCNLYRVGVLPFCHFSGYSRVFFRTNIEEQLCTTACKRSSALGCEHVPVMSRVPLKVDSSRPRTLVDINPFRTAVPLWGQTAWNLTGLPPKWDCGSKGVK